MKAKKQLPFVSIIVPVYNEEKRVRLCLNALLKQTYPNNRLEILIVDNGSTDQTREVVGSYSNPSIQLLEAPEVRSSYAARNKALETAKGHVMAFTDADAIADPDWLMEGVRKLLKDKAWYIGTEVKFFPVNNPATAADYYESIFAFRVKEDLYWSHYAPTVSMMCRKETFDRVGFFDGEVFSGGDTDFGKRVWRAKLLQSFAEKAVMRHPTRGSMIGLLKKSLRYEYGRSKLIIRNPKRYFQWRYPVFILRQLFPPRPDYVWREINRAELSDLPFAMKAKIYGYLYGDLIVKSFAGIVGFLDGKKTTALKSDEKKKRLFWN